MKTYKVRIAQQALDQMESIRKYITDDLVAPQAAVNIIQSFKESIKSLETMPERIKLIEEEPWKSEGIRQMKVKNYFIYFWISEEEASVIIIAVIYASRDQVKQLQNMDID